MGVVQGVNKWADIAHNRSILINSGVIAMPSLRMWARAVESVGSSRSRVWCGALLLSVAGLAQAQQAVMEYRDGELPSASDVADILSRGAAENLRHRGLGSPFSALDVKPVSRVREASALSVPVNFAFDSSELTDAARRQLDVIAEGIRLTEGTVRVVVEGHTDAKGRLGYNDDLSLRRARAVRDYLVGRHGLSSRLFVIEGRGPRALIDKQNPWSARNRRVQFRAG